MMLENWIIKETEAYVRALYATRVPEWRCFHNIRHTLGVVDACKKMSNYYQLDSKHHSILITAAWFHDVGYCRVTLGHETESCAIARAFLMSVGVDEEFIEEIEMLIGATVVSYWPIKLLEKIIRDADMHHIGLPEYEIWNKLLKEEIENDQNKNIPDEQWNSQNIFFLMDHQYYTTYAKEHWEHQKSVNILELLKDSTDFSN